MQNIEVLYILRKISWRKLLNILQLISSYLVSKILRKPLHWGMPMAVSVEPTTACNLHCPECPSGLRSFSRPTGNMKFELYQKYVDGFISTISGMTFYFQGEPFINKDLFNMIRYASSQGVYTMSSTNGHFLNEENCIQIIDSGLDRLVISLDGTTQESYEKYRVGGEISSVLKGISQLVRFKKDKNSKTPFIILQFIVFRHNEHELDDIKILAKRLGVNRLEIKSAQIYNYTKGSDLIPESDVYSRYSKNSDGRYLIKNNFLNECWRMWQGCVITWDGKVVPCCFDKDASHQLGDLNYSSFLEIWKGDKYNELRTQLLMGRSNIEICRNCTEGTLA